MTPQEIANQMNRNKVFETIDYIDSIGNLDAELLMLFWKTAKIPDSKIIYRKSLSVFYFDECQ